MVEPQVIAALARVDAEIARGGDYEAAMAALDEVVAMQGADAAALGIAQRRFTIAQEYGRPVAEVEAALRDRLAVDADPVSRARVAGSAYATHPELSRYFDAAVAELAAAPRTSLIERALHSAERVRAHVATRDRVRRALVYRYAGKWLVHACVRDARGVWAARGPCVALDAQAPPADIGDAIRRALDASRPRAQDTASEPMPDALLQAAGAATWADFVSAASRVEIELTERLAVVPTRSARGPGGWLGRDERAIALHATAGAAELGQAVAAALAMCE